jgi:CBS domain containing-hemolysin-like protein
MLVLKVIGLILLLCISAFFSGSEAALFSLDRLKVKQMSKNEVILQLLKDPHRLLVVLLSGTTIVNIAASGLATLIAIEICRNIGIRESIGTGCAIGVMTFLILFFGEILPITLGATKCDKIAPIIVYPVKIFCFIFTPLRMIIVRITECIVKLIEKHPYFAKDVLITEEELKTMVDVGEKEGVLDAQERKIIHSIFEFGEIMVKEVMTHRNDIACIELNDTPEHIIRAIKIHSRIPVYKETLDNIIGILYAKDVIVEIMKNREHICSSWLRKHIKPSYDVPETKKVNELLKEFQANKLQIAIVRDENNKVVGIISMEDLLEEIVGEIHEEIPELSKINKR